MRLRDGIAAERRRRAALVVVALSLATDASGQHPPERSREYWVYVGAESADLVHRLRLGSDGLVVEKTIRVGEQAAEMEGPHGLSITPNGKYLHMTTGHGLPDGKYWKIELGPDTVVGEPVAIGRFPASVDATADDLYAFVANFNLHGEMVPSSVSVVYTPTNTEVWRVTTCTMPHGSRLDPSGLRHYSTCMMDDQLVEIDARDFSVLRRFGLSRTLERPLAVDDSGGGSAHTGTTHRMSGPTCSPTWAQPSSDGSRIFVACNRSDTIVEIHRDRWMITRRLATGRGPYNLAVTPDGRLLVATLKQGSAVEVLDLESGKSLAIIRTSTTVAHGVVVSPDSRYAFVSSEGVGREPGMVDVIDLRALVVVGSAEVGQQASGIAFWKSEPSSGLPRRNVH